MQNKYDYTIVINIVVYISYQRTIYTCQQEKEKMKTNENIAVNEPKNTTKFNNRITIISMKEQITTT